MGDRPETAHLPGPTSSLPAKPLSSSQGPPVLHILRNKKTYFNDIFDRTPYEVKFRSVDLVSACLNTHLPSPLRPWSPYLYCAGHSNAFGVCKAEMA